MTSRANIDTDFLRVVPISKPSVAGFSFALARSDTEEAKVRENAASQNLLAGKQMRLGPNPQFWSFVDHLKKG
jgi:hypothetical protein